MRNPNGYGSVIDLGKNRRNRYAVRITDTYSSSKLSSDGTFRQKYKYIGYYPTRKEANQALAVHNTSRTPTQYIDITFSEIWDKWCQRNNSDTTTARYTSYRAAFNKCRTLHNKKITDIRLSDLEEVIDLYPNASKSSLNNVKIVMNFIFNWAMANDVVTKNYAELLTIKDYKDVENHKPFNSAEIQDLWNNKMDYMIILIYIYTGCRPSELTNLLKADVHLDENYFYINNSKTKAGIRCIPIAHKIKPFFEYFMLQKGKKFLPITYKDLRQYYSQNIPMHTPHDTRATFVTLMTAAGIQEVIIQKIVGHSGGNVTRDVYTQPEIQTLLEAVNKI